MNIVTTTTLSADIVLDGELFEHLDAQVASAERLLQCVLRQATAIGARDVEAVLKAVAEIQTEMHHRGTLEQRRAAVLTHAADQLSMPAHAVTLDAICTLFDDDTAALARQRSAQLRGLLAEIQQRHAINRALMRQEMAFLAHLTRLLGVDDDAGAYGPSADPSRETVAPRFSTSTHRVLDLEA